MKKLSEKINEAEKAKEVLEVKAKVIFKFEVPTTNIFNYDFIEKNMFLTIKDANNLKIDEIEVISQETKIYEDYIVKENNDTLPEKNNAYAVSEYIMSHFPLDVNEYLDTESYIKFCDMMEDYYRIEKEEALKELNE